MSRFAAVLEVRRQAVDQARRALAALERQRAALVEELARQRAALAEAESAPVPPPWREQLARFAQAMRAQLQQGEARLAELERRIDGARDQLAQAMRELKAIEAVRARDARAAARRAARAEQRLYDERAAARHAPEAAR
ncbi:MAG: flagellar FliJ family protein [Planctomycetota bacterium]|nr:flagellar FliJ family protein [Planctomycetota bacterium]